MHCNFAEQTVTESEMRPKSLHPASHGEQWGRCCLEKLCHLQRTNAYIVDPRLVTEGQHKCQNGVKRNLYETTWPISAHALFS